MKTLTVAELIEELKRFPMNVEVRVVVWQKLKRNLVKHKGDVTEVRFDNNKASIEAAQI